MIALRYLDGKLRQETSPWWRGPVVLVHEPETRLLAPPLSRKLSHRERRRLARGGRKFPRRVAANTTYHLPERAVSFAPKRFYAHRLRRGSEEVLLYLPEAAEVTETHCRDVERWLDEQVPTVESTVIADLVCNLGYRVVGSDMTGFVAYTRYEPVSNIRRWTLNAAFTECLLHSRRVPSRGA